MTRIVEMLTRTNLNISDVCRDVKCNLLGLVTRLHLHFLGVNQCNSR